MIKVAFTSYSPDGEVTFWSEMEQVPAVGDTVHFDDRAHEVIHVSWAYENGPTGSWPPAVWHAELTVR